MEPIKTKEENPKGLHIRYYIQKITGWKFSGESFFNEPKWVPELKEVNEEAEYFVLRLDKNGKDSKHIEACRKGVIAYAKAIKPHLPELAKDLIERYG